MEIQLEDYYHKKHRSRAGIRHRRYMVGRVPRKDRRWRKRLCCTRMTGENKCVVVVVGVVESGSVGKRLATSKRRNFKVNGNENGGKKKKRHTCAA
ncbi:unnamed protein product [Sphenostylis stenocarpa]|uniref:Uncharacterized protein n=1 Tax=Sphenostylis stenocarpa TaxID=92480 RepID=A0AA86SJN0_9FABA|nr:unnamed protein product [Sphenostylis stenocarpa]